MSGVLLGGQDRAGVPLSHPLTGWEKTSLRHGTAELGMTSSPILSQKRLSTASPTTSLISPDLVHPRIAPLRRGGTPRVKRSPPPSTSPARGRWAQRRNGLGRVRAEPPVSPFVPQKARWKIKGPFKRPIYRRQTRLRVFMHSNIEETHKRQTKTNKCK